MCTSTVNLGGRKYPFDPLSLIRSGIRQMMNTEECSILSIVLDLVLSFSFIGEKSDRYGYSKFVYYSFGNWSTIVIDNISIELIREYFLRQI